MDSILSALRGLPKAMAVGVKILNARVIVAFINRHGLLEMFEATYREQLIKADPQIYNREYFHDVASILKEIQDRISSHVVDEFGVRFTITTDISYRRYSKFLWDNYGVTKI
jgi:hypothetical protein